MTGGGQPRSDFAARVIAWQREHGRHDLPWQGTRDAYRIWLSEVMLQQTQVATVLDYFPRFLNRFPDVRALAAAPLDEVLALWSGLGYYSRARNLHRCARAVVDQHDGRLPTESEVLATLPGIGRSTAAAIAAFAAGERVAILDGNVKRVLTRVTGFGEDLAVAAHERALWARAEALLPTQGIEAYTQGLMDLGATVCLVRVPRCEACPVRERCVARAEGHPQRYPVKERRTKRGARRNAMLWLVQGSQCWLVQRPSTGVWAGLWTLPLFDELAAIQATSAGWPGRGRALAPIAHALTHFDWRLEPWRHELPARLGARRRAAVESVLPAGRWFAREEALTLGLPAPVRKLLAAD